MGASDPSSAPINQASSRAVGTINPTAMRSSLITWAKDKWPTPSCEDAPSLCSLACIHALLHLCIQLTVLPSCRLGLCYAYPSTLSFLYSLLYLDSAERVTGREGVTAQKDAMVGEWAPNRVGCGGLSSAPMDVSPLPVDPGRCLCRMGECVTCVCLWYCPFSSLLNIATGRYKDGI